MEIAPGRQPLLGVSYNGPGVVFWVVYGFKAFILEIYRNRLVARLTIQIVPLIVPTIAQANH